MTKVSGVVINCVYVPKPINISYAALGSRVSQLRTCYHTVHLGPDVYHAPQRKTEHNHSRAAYCGVTVYFRPIRVPMDGGGGKRCCWHFSLSCRGERVRTSSKLCYCMKSWTCSPLLYSSHLYSRLSIYINSKLGPIVAGNIHAVSIAVLTTVDLRPIMSTPRNDLRERRYEYINLQRYKTHNVQNLQNICITHNRTAKSYVKKARRSVVRDYKEDDNEERIGRDNFIDERG